MRSGRKTAAPGPEVAWQACDELLQDGVSIESIVDKIDMFNTSGDDLLPPTSPPGRCPTARALAEIMIGASDEIVSLHGTARALITDHLGGLVLETTGPLMFHESSAPAGPVLWLNHDVIAKQLSTMHAWGRQLRPGRKRPGATRQKAGRRSPAFCCLRTAGADPCVSAGSGVVSLEISPTPPFMASGTITLSCMCSVSMKTSSRGIPVRDQIVHGILHRGLISEVASHCLGHDRLQMVCNRVGRGHIPPPSSHKSLPTTDTRAAVKIPPHASDSAAVEARIAAAPLYCHIRYR